MTTLRTAATVAGLLLAGTSLAGCGSQTGAPAASSSASAPTASVTTPSTATPGGSMTPTLDPSRGVTEPDPKATSRTVTGTVSAGVEVGCLVLTTDDGEALQPIGSGLADGDRVTVRGQDATGVMTTCMQGKPFRVLEVVSRER